MADRRVQHNGEPSSVSSTSDMEMFNEPRQRYCAHSPAIPRVHARPNLERVDEEPGNNVLADSSTDLKCRSKSNFYGTSPDPRYMSAAHDGPFKKPAQQACYRYPITPPYYDNRYACGNPMCRDVHYCYEHQPNRECYNPAVPVHNQPTHYCAHECGQPSYMRQMHRTSPMFINPNHPSMKRVEHELARPKPEWPASNYRSGSQAPATPAQYLAALSSKESVAIPPSTATSLRSINLEPFMHPSNFSSPRQSAKLNRKRPTSSPLSIDSIDINSLIRTSPDSLIAYINAPRLSSAGSYGHLSANGISPSPKPQRSPSTRCSPFMGCWQTTTPRPMSQNGKMNDSSETPEEAAHTVVKQEQPEVKEEPKEERMMVDSNNNNVDEAKLMSINSPTESDKRENLSDMENEETNEGEKAETNNEFRCLWKDCNMLFATQDELVKHVNTDHIKKERRDFTCYWIDCQREQKPFKAQYMLVVHMRRHTGEKPNKCPYEGCNKAYSRLENLKTHERSHTGERPYVCEFENCTKAFTNASDRAKHQNRTHSSVKPYICTVPGCTKRYTDPSSLRKHKKTCHPEHFTGAKKPKIDESKGKVDPSKGSPSSGMVGKTEPRGKGQSSSSNATQRTSAVNGNPTSPSESVVRENVKQNVNNLAQGIDFSPQSFHGDMTSSSSYVDSPQSNNIGGDQFEETASPSNTNMPTPKGNSLPRSPQGPAAPSFPERPDMAPRGGGDMLVENPAPSQISLPTINKQNEVGKWIADVSQRMNNTSKYAVGEFRENVMQPDYSSRRSSESGVSSYISSRRSSEVSSHYSRLPHGTVPPLAEEILEEDYPPNRQASDAQCLQPAPPPLNKWNNNVRRNDEGMVRPSPIPDTFDQRRSSSGYGSHHNLTIIRSPVFHKVPIQNNQPPDALPNRRMSDSVVCEADSSNRYFPLRNNNIVPRRSSEPATHYSNTSNDFHMLPNHGLREHRQHIQMSLPDIHHQSQCADAAMFRPLPQPLDRGQKLTHYPYSMEPPNRDYHAPHPPSYPQRNNAPPPARNPAQKGLWEYEQHINQQLVRVRDQQQVERVQRMHPSNNGEMPAADGSLERIVNRMGNLNTSELVEEVALPGGPTNMVINDMNTLLSSLIEEDRYLEKKQSQDNMSTSALSHIF